MFYYPFYHLFNPGIRTDNKDGVDHRPLSHLMTGNFVDNKLN